MLNKRTLKKWLPAFPLVAYVIVFLCWASSGYPTEGKICDPTGSNQNCDSYKLIFYVAVRAIYGLNFYGVLITAIATAVIAKLTVTLAGVGRQQIVDTRILERAYLAVKPLGIRPMRSDPEVLGYIGIINAGKLPARNVHSYVTFAPANAEPKKITAFTIGKAEGANVVAPGIVMRQGTDKSIAVSEIKKLPKDKLSFYVWGIVYYNDGFVDTRHIRFCHRYRWEVFVDEGGRLSAPAVEARYHEYGNGTDED